VSASRRRGGLGWWQLVLAPLLRRRSRVVLSLAALALGASLVTALLSLNAGVTRGLGAQFRLYGANLVLTPAGDRATLPRAAAESALARYPDSAGVLYDVAQLHGRSVVVAGADLSRLRRLNPEWRIEGRLPGPGEAWIGSHAARLLQLRPGERATVAIDGSTARWLVVGTVTAGTSADDQLFAPRAQVAALSRLHGYTTLQFHVPGAAMTAAMAGLRRLLPGAQAEPVRPIAAGEARILLSTRTMLASATLLILFTVLLCVGAGLTTLALQRRRDFGLMKALGASELRVMGGFMGEAALIGAAAALAGIVLGAVVAGAMGTALFGEWIWPTATAILAALVLTIAVAAAAALLPWPIVHSAAPAAILRGE
jgi:putative ABC transport system permease protein